MISRAWGNWLEALQNGARVQLMLDHPVEYEMDQGRFNFFLKELHGIWDEKATIFNRLSRASFLNYAMPSTNNYFLDIGLVPYSKEYPGADLPYLTALN